MSFTGTRDGIWKYPVSIVLPFLVSLPITVALFLIFTVLGVPLK
jgi:hypothetical protein